MPVLSSGGGRGATPAVGCLDAHGARRGCSVRLSAAGLARTTSPELGHPRSRWLSAGITATSARRRGRGYPRRVGRSGYVALSCRRRFGTSGDIRQGCRGLGERRCFMVGVDPLARAMDASGGRRGWHWGARGSPPPMFAAAGHPRARRGSLAPAREQCACFGPSLSSRDGLVNLMGGPADDPMQTTGATSRSRTRRGRGRSSRPYQPPT